MQCSCIKQSKIPNILFYNPVKSNNYRMIDLSKRTFIGEMSAAKRNELFLESLYIKSEFRRQGYGNKFLDFAVMLSKKMGLKGNLRLLASLTTNDIKNPPHIFYRKYGFTSDDKETLAYIDECMKNHRQASPLTTPAYMYYKA